MKRACAAAEQEKQGSSSPIGAETETETGIETGRGWLGAICADLAAPVRSGCVDVLVFNPPYVPTESVPVPGPGQGEGEQEEGQMLELAWAGGQEGMEVTRRVLGDLDGLLSQRGVAYVLLCKGNRPERVVEGLREQGGGGGWEAEVVGSSGKQAGWEKLVVLRIWRRRRT